jgi:hypothetical protein
VRVNGLLIEAFRAVELDAVSARAALFEFDEARYVGVRRTESDRRIGPTALVDPETQYKRTSFPERLIDVTSARRPYFGYDEPWTVPPWTLNVIAPPQGFVATELVADFLDDSGRLRFRPATDEGRLFYFALFQGSGEQVAFETRGVFAYDPAAAEKEAWRAERARQSNWRNYWAVVAEPLSTTGEIISAVAAMKSLLGY